MASNDNLKTWFERDIKFATWSESVQVDESDPGKTVIRFYTDTNEYQLTLTPQENEAAPRFECAVRARKARAGLAAPRVRHLWRGRPHRLNERMWRRFLGAVVGLELVRVHRSETAEKATEEGDQALEPAAAAIGALPDAAEHSPDPSRASGLR